MPTSTTPLFDALQDHIHRGVKRFHVPGHKGGVKKLADVFSQRVLDMDLNAMADLDDLCSAHGVIQQSQQLMANFFKSDQAHYSLNGATSGIQAMLLTCVDPGEKIILPRNVHRSVMHGLIVSGAIPIFLPVSHHPHASILTHVRDEDYDKALEKFPDAKAVFFVNPNYYGMGRNLSKHIQKAHDLNMLALVDEAHGTFSYLSDANHQTAMQAGADLSVVSLHKNGGSFTQTAVLLAQGKRYNQSQLFESLDMLRSTSSSYLLMLSLELAREFLETEGSQKLKDLEERCDAFIQKASSKGLHFLSKADNLNIPNIDFCDPTRLTWSTRKLGISGFYIDSLLAKKYNVQSELSMLDHVLFLMGLTDGDAEFQALEECLLSIVQDNENKDNFHLNADLPDLPELIVSPRDAFYSEKKSLNRADCVGQIAGEMIMVYPPGIPLLCPGERIDKVTLDYLDSLIAEGAFIQGMADPNKDTVRVLSLGIGR